MKGDFSEWDVNQQSNHIGVLHQQGRGLLDQDWNAATVIAAQQRKVLANDAIGAHVAAVPAEQKDSFKVTAAEANADGVALTLNPGRLWLSGFVIDIDEWATLPQPATYLPPPFHTPAVDTSSIAAGVRDAVILEVYPEAVNAFQYPQDLLEPALGGVDTTERVKLYQRLRLLRLEEGDECGNLKEKLQDDFSGKGTLTVTADVEAVTGDCPVEAGGGYTGFEHHLIRVEIATPEAGEARFKWSRFNGGLVGRGIFHSADDRIFINANDQMINHCGLTAFYLEALQENSDTGEWDIVFTADATLSADGELDLLNIQGTWPGGDGSEAFFRLWDGVDNINNFPVSVTANPLALGLRLQFETPTADHSNYHPGDFWTFPVRAIGAVGFDAGEAWPNDAPPQGVHYERVPLAIITWNSALPSSVLAPESIHDCRRVFQPLAKLDSCCSVTVGDGMRSHGDYDSIQDAVNALPASGGSICVYKGEYPENIVIDKPNVTISGCGDTTRIFSDNDLPVVTIRNVSNIRLKNFSIEARAENYGLLIETTENIPQAIAMQDLLIQAGERSAVQVNDVRGLSISNSRFMMRDVPSDFHAVFLIGDDIDFEHNRITVSRSKEVNASLGLASAARGGLHIGGTSENVRIIDNIIEGGIGNGITLGTLVDINQGDDDLYYPLGWVVGLGDPCDPCAPGSVYIPPGDGTDGAPEYQSAGNLFDIRIERNRIRNFGLNGIGVVAFFDLEEEDEFISVDGLDILGNHIENCLSRTLAPTPDNMVSAMGYGGISLADVDNLVVHNNHILNNGPDHLQPICGVYVLHGEGIDISGNRILNNGAKTLQSANDANQGARAGIWIEFTTAPKVMITASGERYPRQNGVPALKVHDNIVRQPLGRALSVTALGPVSVLGNQLTSQGFVYSSGAPSFFASTVYIFNLGISNELYLQQILYSGETLDDVPGGPAPDSSDEFYTISQPGLDSQRFFGYLGNGNVLCNDNQILLDLLDTTGFQLGVTSIAVASLDDVSFQNNQCDISYDLIFDEIFLMQAVVLGWTCRANSNRFKESLVGALFSAITLGLLANTTVNNQATHCLRAFNLLGPGFLRNTPNTIMLDIFGVCPQEEGLLTQSGNSILAQANTQPQSVLSLLG